MRVYTLVVAVIALIAAPRTLASQTIPSPYRFIETDRELGALAGWIAPKTGRFGYGPSPGPLTGIRLGFDFGGPISVEGMANWVPTTRNIVDPRRAEGDRVIGETDATLLALDLLLRLSLTGPRTWYGLSPFVAVGAGLAWDLSAKHPLEEGLDARDRFKLGTTFVAPLGGGLRWFLSDRYVVRMDAMLHLWRLKAPDGFRDPERGFGNVGESEWTSASAFSLGVGYRF